MAPKQLSTVLLAVCATFLAIAAPLLAGDPDMLQDVCVADLKSCESSLLLNYTHIFVSQLRCVLALADMAFS